MALCTKTHARMFCTCGCCVLGSVVLVLGFTFVGPLRSQFIDNVYDLMFIDDTSETDFTGPLGDVVAERQQFKAWSTPMKQAFRDCAKEHSAAECINGIDVTVGVFNVTNPEDVLKGDLPRLQELGPISAKMYSDKVDIDEKLWDSTGVAKFRIDTSYELDTERCEETCRNLLEESIIVPNPAWASISSMGAELVLAAIVTVSSVAMQGKDPAVVFGLNAEEAAPFSQVFLLEKDTQVKLASVGAFLATASAAASKAAKGGGTSGTCQLGALALPALKCIHVLIQIQQMIPMSWAGTMKHLSKAYGTGAAAPVFIRVKVKEALGFNASFTDPLLQMGGLSFSVLHSHLPPQSDPPGLSRYAQMSSKFANEGTSYITKFYDASHDCRYDPDCKLGSASLDSCEASDTCTPADLRGYTSTGFPGRMWDTALGFEDLQMGRTFQSFKDGKTSELSAVHENMVASVDGELEYLELTLSSLKPRIENCDGKEPGSPGIDCAGPLHAANLAPAAMGVPLYVSMPYFDNRLLVTSIEAQKAAAYHPANRVVISKCTDNSWCDDSSFGRHNTSVWVEPHSGIVFRAQVATQMNMRLGFMPSMLHPKINDTLVPIYWAAESVVAPERMLKVLIDIQGLPKKLEGWFLICVLVGTAFLLCACFGVFYAVYERKCRETPVKVVDN